MAAILMENRIQGVILSRIFVSKPLVFALSLAFSSTVYAVGEDWGKNGLRCYVRNDAALSKAQGSGEQQLPADVTRVTADRVAGQSSVRARAEGDVIIERNGETLNSQWADYDQQTDTVRAGDDFVLTRADGETVHGKDLSYHMGNSAGKAVQAQFEAEKNGRRLQGVGNEVEMKDKQRYAVRGVKFNTCQPGDTSWYIQAAELTTNQETGIGVAKHARLVFGGVPVLYTPWADFPVNGNRKSGFLVPTLKTGSDGLEIELPYYLNLAPNYDATVSPGFIASRGPTIAGEFRYLQPKYTGSIYAKYMPVDWKSEHKNRSEIKIRHQHRFGSHLTADVDFNQVSDDDYYQDFYGLNDIVTNINLNRSAALNYNNTFYGGSFYAQLLASKYQTLRDTENNSGRPYAMLPRLSVGWNKRILKNGELSVESQLTRFTHDTKQQGTRLVAYPSLRWDFHNSWGYIRPKVGLHASEYWLSSYDGTPSRRTSRVLPITNVDAGITLERTAKIFGKNYIQTLEPRVFYNYIPSKAQNHLPNFDTSENDFSYQQLFRENIYSGYDRINASNSLSVGVQTRFFDRATNEERFRAGIGQKYYFTDDNVLLSGSVDTTPRKRSDIAAFAGGQVTDGWYADANWHYNETSRKTQEFDIGARYNPEPGKVISARYKYGRNEEIYSGFYDKLKRIDLAVQWPINKNLSAIGRLNYGISPRLALDQMLGLEYKNNCGCWSVSVVGQRYITGQDKYKTAFFLTLQLKDLSNIGKDPYEELRLGIPGYYKTNEVFTK